MTKNIINLAAVVGLAACLASAPVWAAAGAELKAGRAAFEANACGNCHQASESTIGPSLKDIARRYAGKPVATAVAQRIRAGSEGRWGGPPHPAYEGMDEADALAMAKWIPGGAPR